MQDDALPGADAGWHSWLTLRANPCIEACQDAVLHMFCLGEESPMPYRLSVTVVSVFVLLLGFWSVQTRPQLSPNRLSQGFPPWASQRPYLHRNYPGRLRAPMPSAFTAFLGKG